MLNNMISPLPKESATGQTSQLSISLNCSPSTHGSNPHATTPTHNNHLTTATTVTTSPTTTTLKTKEVAPFLKNLRKMLDCESDDILRWTSNGKAFEIHDMEKMMSYVLPKYFKHRKYTSFQRQLNYFNFRKWTKSKAVVCTFSNEFFLRDQPELSWRITRKKSMSPSNANSKGTGHLKVPSKNVSSASAASTASSAAVPTMAMHPAPVMHQSSHQHHHHHHQHQHQHAPVRTTSESIWKKPDHEVANIIVPSVKSEFLGEPYPSPTEMDVMLYEHDGMAGQPSSFTSGGNGMVPSTSSYEHELDSLDWIDSLLPLDINGRMDEPAYHFESEASLRSTTNGNVGVFGGYSMHPSSGFGCMAGVL